MSRKKSKKQIRFRRVESTNMTRDQAMMKNKQARMAILKRRRRLLITAMASTAAVVILFVAFLAGAFERKAATTTLTVKQDGSIVFEEVSSLEEKTSESELKGFVTKTIDTYNASAKEGDVRLKNCDVSGEQVYLKTIYKNAETYKKFTGLPFYLGSIAGASKSGYTLPEALVSVSGTKKTKQIKMETLAKDETKKLLILDQPIDVIVPQTILAVSNEGTTVKASGQVGIEEAVETFIIY